MTYEETRKCVYKRRYSDIEYKEGEMGITAKSSGGNDFKPIPEGMYQGVAYMVFDLGTQFNERYNNSSRKVLVGWEIPDERIDIDGVSLPMVISKRYTLSLHEKAILRGDLEAWRSKKFTAEELNGFDIAKLLGVNCNIQILHNENEGKTYANVVTVTPLMKGQEKKEVESEFLYYSFEDNNDFPEETPEWIVKIAKKSQEWQDIHELGDVAMDAADAAQEEPPPVGDDQIPF